MNPTSLSRVVRLALRFAWASRTKFVLLTLLIGIGMTVFLVVSELSRVSSVGLEDAIIEDVGEAGTYRIELPTDLGLEQEQLYNIIVGALDSIAAGPITMIEVLPAITPECPPYEELGRQPILVLWESPGRPATLPFGQELPVETELCFAGQEIPAGAVYIPTPSEQEKWGIGLAIRPVYRDIVTLSTNDPVRYTFSVVTNQREDQSAEIEGTARDHLRDAALRHGVEVEDVVLILRTDTGDSIRTASEGVRLVYALIAWGILLLGALALLVSELIVVRDRRWFFGLARALGARSAHIAGLVLTDVLLVLLAGGLLAVLATTAVQPIARSFAREAFQVEVVLLNRFVLPQLVAGASLVLVVAALYPTISAVRQDPLDVLEPAT